MKPKDRLFFRMVIVTPLVVVILLFLKFYFKTDEIFIEDITSVSSYLTVIGTLYSILAAFVIYVVWGQYNVCKDAVENEADDLQDLIRYAGYLNDPKFENDLKSAISNYARLVTNIEWKKLENGKLSPKTEEAFYNIYDTLKNVKFDDEKDPLAWQVIIKKFNDISDARHTRISNSIQRIPSVLRILHYLVSVSVIVGFFLLGITNNFIAVAITALTTIVVVLIIEVIEDLDDPFTGKWMISKEPFEKLA